MAVPKQKLAGTKIGRGPSKLKLISDAKTGGHKGGKGKKGF